MSPAEFTTIKQKIQSSAILSDQEKKEWLFLLPRMTPIQIKELDRILSLKIPSLPSSPGVGRKPERAGEVEMKRLASRPAIDLRAPSSDIRVPQSARHLPSPPKPARPAIPFKPVKLPSPEPLTPKTPPGLRPPSPQKERGEAAGLKFDSLTVEAVRQAPSIYVFLEGVAGQMRKALAARTATLGQITESFEQSPLYQQYLAMGLSALSGGKTGALTQGEFEAIADFRSSMRKM